MSTRAKASGSDFQQIPAGTYPAYCFAVIDIGHQEGSYKGMPTVKPQVILSFEFPTERIIIDGEDKPMMMSTFYTLSLSKKANLKSDLEAWRGRPFTQAELDGFDLKTVIGHACTVSVYHNENGKARVKNVNAAMKGIPMPPMYNKPLWFDIDEHGCNGPEFSAVPEWIQEFINKRVEPEGAMSGEREPEFHDSPIPF